MPATSEDRLFGLTTSVAVKPPVAISADYNVTTFGEQTITSSTMTGDRTVTTTQDMRVLLMNQDDKRDNGIWMAGPVTWRRAPDFDGARDVVNGTIVFSIYGDCWQVEGTNPIRIGYDEISFRSTYPFSEELNLYQRTIRTSDPYIEPLPSLSEAEGKTIVVQSGVPRWVTPESGTATDVLTELAKSDGATKIGSGTHTVQHVLDMKFDKTGGTVNGDIISQGTQISLKGDGRKHLGFHNQDGSVRMWLYKDKGGDGVRLHNGNDGGGEYVFHKDGGFRAPSSVHAGAARIAADGNIYGSQWGDEWLDAYLRKTFQPKGDYSKPNTAKSEVSGWWKCGDTGYITQYGHVIDVSPGEVRTVDFNIPFKQAVRCIVVTPDRSGIQSGLIGGYAAVINNESFNLTNDYANQEHNSNFWWMAVGM